MLIPQAKIAKIDKKVEKNAENAKNGWTEFVFRTFVDVGTEIANRGFGAEVSRKSRVAFVVVKPVCTPRAGSVTDEMQRIGS